MLRLWDLNENIKSFKKKILRLSMFTTFFIFLKTILYVVSDTDGSGFATLVILTFDEIENELQWSAVLIRMENCQVIFPLLYRLVSTRPRMRRSLEWSLTCCRRVKLNFLALHLVTDEVKWLLFTTLKCLTLIRFFWTTFFLCYEIFLKT